MTRTTKLFILGGIGVLCYRVVFFSAFAYPCTDLGDTIWFTVVILPAIGLLVFGYGIWFYKQKKKDLALFLSLWVVVFGYTIFFPLFFARTETCELSGKKIV